MKASILNSTKRPNNGLYIEEENHNKVKLEQTVCSIDGHSELIDYRFGRGKFTRDTPSILYNLFTIKTQKISGITILKTLARQVLKNESFLIKII